MNRNQEGASDEPPIKKAKVDVPPPIQSSNTSNSNPVASADDSSISAPVVPAVVNAVSSTLSSTVTTPSSTPSKHKKKKFIKVDGVKYKEICDKVKKMRMQISRTLSVSEKLDIIAVQAYLRHQHYLKPTSEKKKVNFYLETAQALRRSTAITGETWSTFLETGGVEAVEDEGPRGRKLTRFKNTPALRDCVRQWLLERLKTKQRTMAKDVMQFLISINEIGEGDVDTQKKKLATLRTVQRYLGRNGFVVSRINDSLECYVDSARIARHRDAYIFSMTTHLEANTRFIFVGESFIHHHYTPNDQDTIDPDCDRPMNANQASSEKFYRFVAATVSGLEGSPASLLSETVQIHAGDGGAGGPWHKCFSMNTPEYFQKWFQALLEILATKGITNTVIIVERAKHRLAIRPGMLTSKSSKAAMLEACRALYIPLPRNPLKRALWTLLEPWIEPAEPEVTRMAKAAGHQVHWLPPHYYNINPMEGIFQIIKGEVGRQHNAETTFAQVESRLIQAFNTLSSDTVHVCIEKAHQELKSLSQQLFEIEEGLMTVDDSQFDPDVGVDEYESEDEEVESEM